MKSFWVKLLLTLTSVFFIFVFFILASYRWFLPALVNSSSFSSFVEKEFNTILKADLKIEGQKLRTGKHIAFTVNKLSVEKDGNKLLYLSNIDVLISLEELFSKRMITFKKLLAEEIFLNAKDFIEILPEQKPKKEEKKELPVKINLYNILLGVKKTEITYKCPQLDLNFKARHMIFDRTHEKKFLHFDFDFDLKKDSHKISVSANDKNRIFMENGVAYIKDFPIEIEKSKININAFMTRENKYELNISAKDFNAKDVEGIVRSDIIIANGSQMLEPVGNVKGTVDFNVKLAKNIINGNIDIKNVNFEVIPLLNMPVRITKGHVDIGNKDIIFKDFEGYYNNKTSNKLKLHGETKDYQKTCDTKIISDVRVTQDFFKNYLSKMLGYPISIIGEVKSRLVLKSKNGSLDVLWFFLLNENEGFKLGEQSMVLKDYKTLFKLDMSLVKNILKINTLNYYITNELKRGIKPLLTLKGNYDIQTQKLLDTDLDIPHPLPSEFLNFLIGQSVFKKGNVSGNMYIENKSDIPHMRGEFALDKVIIPAQRIYVRSAKMTAKGNRIELKTEGRFRRENYKFDGYLVNELKLPIIVKDVNLTVDNIDIDKMLTQQTNTAQSETEKSAFVSTGEDNEENLEPPDFPKNTIVIEKCGLNLLNGVYKEIKFGNIHADMTLDKEGNLYLKSNRFDIAQGISSLRVNANLADKKYNLKLGVKDVDSNIMATSILGLPRQISGKAKGFLDLSTDKSLKLNGSIKFNIQNGSIEQIGYVEYILKAASIFRNPLAMVSPTTIIDLVSIPNGNFDEINGEMKIKDDIVERMKIVSTAPELATLIFGRYNLKSNDASLRIYTKFSSKTKGFSGFLRNFSLNTLATKLSISARNESNYYSNELAMIPKLKDGEEKAQVFLTKVDGDILNYNFLSLLKRIK